MRLADIRMARLRPLADRLSGAQQGKLARIGKR
jgi:hypothetical protein